MRLFKKRDKAPEPQAAPTPPTKVGGKGRPTPKRKVAQARKLHPVVPADRKAAKREAAAKRNEAWENQRRAMATGEERYLPARDKGPIKRYIRDYIDARYSLGETFMPLVVVLLVLTFTLQSRTATVTLTGTLIIYLLFFASIIDTIICWLTLRKRLRAKFGQDKLAKQGLIFWYIFGRCFNIRRLRQPAPQVGRREYPS
ncbi:DUF3043 domain-containing protein [Actinomyces oricola]|uniref:DUF3043 domain-containing protein n=1 Tax=Actinomyces oricola TaxID=206043 RepID=UPI000FFEBC7C|nr:DUF3043 domain-containing protein [Actinomyces oricola]